MTGKMKQIAAGSGLIAIAIFVSRFLGLLREVVISSRFGAQNITDIYQASFMIPDMLNYLLAGGAFSIVLIPMLSKYITEDGKSSFPKINEKGQEIFSAIFTPFTIIITSLTIIALILTPFFTTLLFPKYTKNPIQFLLLVRLTRIVLPAQIFFMTGGLINAVLRARGDFRGNVWGPIIYNLGIIAGGFFLARFMGIEGLSLGALTGAILGPFFICFWLARHSIEYKLSLDFKSPELKEYLKLTIPLMVGVSLLTVDQLLIRFFGARAGIAEGTISCLNYSRTIMLIPIGLVGQAAGQASLTYLSHLWQQGQKKEFTITLNQTMRAVIFLSFIFAGGIFLLAKPIVTLVFFRKAFTIANSHYTSELLRYIIFAVPPFAALQILVNGYYSRKNTLRPMVVSSICTVASFFVYYMFSERFKGPGIAIASLVCFWILFLVTFADYYYRYSDEEHIDIKSYLSTGIKSFLSVLFALCITYVLFENPGVIHFNPDKKWGAGLLIGFAGACYTGLVIGASMLMGGDEADTLKRLLKKIIRKIIR